jgi:hypothetical protein
VAATLHKLTAGDGYLYLIRQVAAADSTERGRNTLSEYYSARGESPGRWVGTGLASLSSTGARDVSEQALQEIWTVPEGSEVHEEQMAALFGEGLHPNAVDITNYTLGRGAQPAVAIESAHLGRRFAVRTGETEFQRALAVAYREHNTRLGQKWNTPIDDDVRAQIRTTLARQRFADQYGREPADDRELSGFIARNTRARTTAVAGYDVTFSPVKSVSALWAVAPLDVAREIEECHDAEALALGVVWSDDRLIAVHEDSTPVRHEWYSDEFQRLRERAGLRRIHLKGLRNTSVSLMLSSGIPVHIVAGWHGHDPAVSLSIYSEAQPDDLRAAAASLFG